MKINDNIITNFFKKTTVRYLSYLGLCAAYLQGGINKLMDFQSAKAEMDSFGLSPSSLFAVLVIILELVAPIMILSGILRWLGSLALAGFTLLATFIALRFWELPLGIERTMTANAFFEHLGLVGGFFTYFLARSTGKNKYLV